MRSLHRLSPVAALKLNRAERRHCSYHAAQSASVYGQVGHRRPGLENKKNGLVFWYHFSMKLFLFETLLLVNSSPLPCLPPPPPLCCCDWHPPVLGWRLIRLFSQLCLIVTEWMLVIDCVQSDMMMGRSSRHWLTVCGTQQGGVIDGSLKQWISSPWQPIHYHGTATPPDTEPDQSAGSCQANNPRPRLWRRRRMLNVPF